MRRRLRGHGRRVPPLARALTRGRARSAGVREARPRRERHRRGRARAPSPRGRGAAGGENRRPRGELGRRDGTVSPNAPRPRLPGRENPGRRRRFTPIGGTNPSGATTNSRSRTQSLIGRVWPGRDRAGQRTRSSGPSSDLLPTLERPSVSRDLLAVSPHARPPLGHPLGVLPAPLSLKLVVVFSERTPSLNASHPSDPRRRLRRELVRPSRIFGHVPEACAAFG